MNRSTTAIGLPRLGQRHSGWPVGAVDANQLLPSSLVETYAYDANNNLISKTDHKGQTIQYVYDAPDRLAQKNYPRLHERGLRI